MKSLTQYLINKLGYKDNSPFKDSPELYIESPNITMKGVSKTLIGTPIHMDGSEGKSQIMYPEKEYIFENAIGVKEKPIDMKAKLVLLDHNGKPQMPLTGKEIVFSRISTKRILDLAEKVKQSGESEDAILKLGEYVYKERMAQKKRDNEI